MGCCVSTHGTSTKHQNFQVGSQSLKPESSHESRAPPPLIEEETVKEVLSETPKLKPPPVVTQLIQPIKNPGQELHYQETNKNNILVDPPFPDEKIKTNGHKEEGFIVQEEEISEKEVCSLSFSETVSTTTFNNDKRDDDDDDDGEEVKQKVKKSPVAKLTPRNSAVSGYFGPTRDRSVGKSPNRRTDQSPDKRNNASRGGGGSMRLVQSRESSTNQLVDLLRRHKSSSNSRAINGVIRRAADAITNLAHENNVIKTCVRIEGGIPPLVELLEFVDVKVQRAAAGALRTLAFKNDENKNQIVQCNALPTLILMLQSEDPTVHCEAVGVIGNLVHSSPNIKKEVLLAGALQPVIGLLSSSCSESQREAALLLGQFAAADSDCKVHIVQRGAVRPLIDMLESPDAQIKEMSAFALGRLAQEMHNQAGIAHSGGIVPLLKLLESKNGSLQHNAAFALYGLADNEDNVAELVKVGGFQKLQDGEFIVQATKDCVDKTLKRLEEKVHGQVLNHLLYLMRVAEKSVQGQIALALAHLCAPDDRKAIFLDNNGLELLLGLLESGNQMQQHAGAAALYKLAAKTTSVSLLDAAPLSPTPQVYLGEQFVNNPTLSDVTFLVEGKRFYAHRICLLASSDAFRAMFDGGYRERDAKDVEIPNIRWDVFELMMRFIYTGSVDVDIEVAQDLLRAADQYLLEGLKLLCEYTIAQDISVKNVSLMYELSEGFNARSLMEACILFIFEQFDKLSSKPWCSHLIQHILPEVRDYFTKALTKPIQANLKQV